MTPSPKTAKRLSRTSALLGEKKPVLFDTIQAQYKLFLLALKITFLDIRHQQPISKLILEQ